MKLEHKLLLFFGFSILLGFVIIKTYIFLMWKEVLEERNAYCEAYGENLTLELQKEESYVVRCECFYQRVKLEDLESECVCKCYTNGTVCPHFEEGRCYFLVPIIKGRS